MRISDWSSDVCSSDLILIDRLDDEVAVGERVQFERRGDEAHHLVDLLGLEAALRRAGVVILAHHAQTAVERRSEEHTSELQSLMRISYAVFCLTKKKKI